MLKFTQVYSNITNGYTKKFIKKPQKIKTA